jgi:hypothetical protein
MKLSVSGYESLKQYGEILMGPPPTLLEAERYKHSELIKCLRHCPLSEFFGCDRYVLNERTVGKKRAR